MHPAQHAAGLARRVERRVRGLGEIPPAQPSHRYISIAHMYQPYKEGIFYPYPQGMPLGDFLDERRNRLVVGTLAAAAVVGTALVVFGKPKKRRRA